MAACSSESQVVAFFEGRLAHPEAEILQDHLDTCARCFALLAELALPATDGDGTPDTWRPPARVEEFRLIKPIGRGVGSQVWQACDERLDRQVAIKFLVTEAHAAARERFRRREARAVGRLSHPNIVTVYRVGEVDGRPFLVSELVRGRSLDQLPKPVPWRRALELAVGLGRGLAAAHHAGVVHRDIKPANVILTEDGQVKLLDFGLAKLLDGDIAEQTETGVAAPAAASAASAPAALTMTGSVLGTPLYMAPETWESSPATTRTDVYALGAVVYELCTGRPPYIAGTLAGLRRAVLEVARPSFAGAQSDVDPELAAIVDRCLAHDPAVRFASGEPLCQALERVQRRVATPHRPRWGARLVAVLCAILALAAVVAVAWPRLLGGLDRSRVATIRRATAQVSGRRCSADRWCWDAAWQGNLNGVWAASPSDVWAVGERGTVRHFDGAVWSPVANPNVSDLQSVQGTAADDIWAVGQSGTILHWDGGSLRQTESGSKVMLSDVWARARDDAWAVGLDGATLHWDGHAWRRVPSTTVEDLVRVGGTAADDVWAVGYKGTIIHWDGVRWSLVPSGTRALLMDLWVGGRGLAWAVGKQSTILRWDGTTWQHVPVPDVIPPAERDNYPFNAVTATGPNDVWLIPWHWKSPFFHFDGNRWTSHPRATTRVVLRARLTSPNDGWAVGAVADRWDGQVWHGTEPQPPHTHWLGVWASGPENVWTVGTSDRDEVSTACAARWDGIGWHDVDLPRVPVLAAVGGSAPDDVWLVGQAGTALHHDGRRTVAVATGVDVSLHGVYSAAPDAAWAAGDGGTLLRWNGSRWTRVSSGTSLALDAVWGTGIEHAWAVGEHGVILQLSAAGVRQIDSPTTARLRGIWGTDAGNIWAVGADGTVLHYDGRTWEHVASNSIQDLYGVGGSGRDDIWAVGSWWSESGASIIHWDGVSWTALSHTPRTWLLGVWSISSTDAWAVGIDASVLRFEPPRP